MIRLHLKFYSPSQKFGRERTVAILNLLFFILACPHMAFGDDIIRRFDELKAQYKAIKTVHLRSQLLRKTYFDRVQDPTSNTAQIYQMSYEYWANDQGHYRGHAFLAGSDDNPEHDVEFADNGEIWQYFQRNTSTFSYGKKRFDQNPEALENPLLSPLSFLGRDDDNCRACDLKLEDVLNDETWRKKVANARIVMTSDQVQGQVVVEIPGGVLIGKEFVFHVYFRDAPDFLPAKINWVDTEGETFKSIEIVYEAMDLDGKQTYWPKSVHGVGMPLPGTIIEELNVETEIFEINQELSSDIFTIDFSSAEVIWHNDLELFVRQKGGFYPPKLLVNPPESPKPITNASDSIAVSKKLPIETVVRREPMPEQTKDSVTDINLKSRAANQHLILFLIVAVVTATIVMYVVSNQGKHQN